MTRAVYTILGSLREAYKYGGLSRVWEIRRKYGS